MSAHREARAAGQAEFPRCSNKALAEVTGAVLQDVPDVDPQEAW